MKAHLACLASFVLAVCGSALAQTLQVNPQRVLSDEPAVIRASELQPGERVTIKADLDDGAGERWESQAEFLAGRMLHPLSGAEVDLGGTPEGNAESSLDAIPKVLKFQRDGLSSTPAQPASAAGSNH